jgi:uncharacterized membrane protein YgcG
MSRLHSTLVAFVLGAAAATGLFAVVRTARLGQKVAAPQTALIARELAARHAKLARWNRSLQQARAKHPPALPKIPKFAPVPASPAPATPYAAPAATSPVTYVRPRAVVKYRHASTSHTSTGSSKPSSSDDGRSDDGGGDDSSGGGD